MSLRYQKAYQSKKAREYRWRNHKKPEFIARRREFARQWYGQHRKMMQERAWHNRQTWLTYAKDVKGGMCTACGITDYRLLEFDHRDENDKEFTIAQIYMPKNPSMEQQQIFWSEVNKCRLLCGNCHKLRSWHDLCIVDREIDCRILSPE